MQLFKSPQFFAYFALFLAAGGALLYIANLRKRKIISAFFDAHIYEKLAPEGTAKFKRIKDALFFTGLFFAFTAMAGPQWGTEFSSSALKTTQAVIAVDLSLSMLAQDVKPSRIESAKLMFSMLVEQMKEYRVGIVGFSSKAYTHCPVTTDTSALKYFITRLDAGGLPLQGTSVASALDLSTYMLSRYSGIKAVVVLSDGEDHDSKKLAAALENAEKNGIQIITVGIGTRDGGLIPLKKGGYKTDKEGRPVVTKLSPDTLLQVAKASKGAYIEFSSPQNTLNEVMTHLNEIEKTMWQGKARSKYKNRYQIPLVIAFLFILLEFIFPERKIKWKE